MFSKAIISFLFGGAAACIKTNQEITCLQSPSGHRVESLPYFQASSSSWLHKLKHNFSDQTDQLPCMYAGNLKSSDLYNNNFFYWLFQSPDQTPSKDVPLVVYMNGGPGSTSMNALFMETGPLRVVQTDPNDNDSFVVTYQPEQSWQSLGDLLFIDHPVGTGWSYGEHSPTTLPEIAAELLSFLKNFYAEFPERRQQELVLAGESFAGKYLSFTAQAILDHNSLLTTDSSDYIRFQRLVLSNPLVDVETERMHQHELGYTIGLYDESNSAQVETLRRHCEETITDSTVSVATAETNCKNILNYIAIPTGNVNQMDTRYFDSDDIPADTFQYMFINSAQVDAIKQALHITKPQSFSKTNSTVSSAIVDRNENTAYVYTNLLAQGVQILLNIGQFDMKDGVRQTYEWTKQIEFPGKEEYDLRARALYTYTEDGVQKVGGYFRNYNNFTLIVVPKAGHMVPASQVLASKNMISDLLKYDRLMCDGVACSSIATSMCDYMNSCSGHGSCSSSTHGKCVCDSGYFGADCSVQVNQVLTTSIPIKGTKWTYFQMPSGQTTFGFTLQSDYPFDVYIAKGTTNLPDPSNFNILFKQEQYLQLTQFSFNASIGFIMGIYMHHVDSTTLDLKVQVEPLMLRASPAPAAPAPPMYNLPKPDPIDTTTTSYDEDLISNLQYMCLGVVFGILGTLLYWRCARSHQQIQLSRSMFEDPNQYLRTKQGQPSILFNADSDDEKDDLKKDLP